MIFQYEITDLKIYLGRKDKEAAFDTWAADRLPTDGKHLKYENGKSTPFKGKTHAFVAVSYGDYMGGDGRPRRFVSYRAAVVNHTIVYTWAWEDNRWLPFTTQEFITF